MNIVWKILGALVAACAVFISTQVIDVYDVSYDRVSVIKERGSETGQLMRHRWALGPHGHFAFLRRRAEEAESKPTPHKPHSRYAVSPGQELVRVAPDGTRTLTEIESPMEWEVQLAPDGGLVSYGHGRLSAQHSKPLTIVGYDGGCGLDYRRSRFSVGNAGTWIIDTHAEADLGLYSPTGERLVEFDACSCGAGRSRCCPDQVLSFDSGVVIGSVQMTRWLDNSANIMAERVVMPAEAVSPSGVLLTRHPLLRHRWGIETPETSTFFDSAFLGSDERIIAQAITDRFAYLLTMEATKNKGLRLRLRGRMQHVTRLHRFDHQGKRIESILLPVEGSDLMMMKAAIATPDDVTFYYAQHQMLDNHERVLLSQFEWQP